jgi:Mn-dependent DtxR family transcriptional regulator
MGVTVCLPLFGPPSRELEEGAALGGQQLRNLATKLHERLHKAAEMLDRLAAAGWTTRVAMYDVILTQPGVETKEDAIRRLAELGIATEELIIMEDVEEDETPISGDRDV